MTHSQSFPMLFSSWFMEKSIGKDFFSSWFMTHSQSFPMLFSMNHDEKKSQGAFDWEETTELSACSRGVRTSTEPRYVSTCSLVICAILAVCCVRVNCDLRTSAEM